MSKILMSLAALTFIGATALPLQATAAERQAGGISNAPVTTAQPTDVSSQRRYYRHRYGYYGRPYWGPRRYYGPSYGYYGYPRYGYGYGRPYGYYNPGISVGVGPFGFRFF